MDFFIDRLYKQVILEHLKKLDNGGFSDNNITADGISIWKANTRLMFWNYPAIQVYDLVDESLKEASDEQYFENKIHQQSLQEPPKPKKIVRVKGTTRQLIDANLKISDVARKYGLNVKKNKICCPFHDDKEPSLSLSDEKNVFHCFGCNVSGDIIEFIRRMEELKNG